MKHQVQILITMFTVVLVSSIGCTDLKDGLPPPVAPGVQAHHPSWIDTASTNFHGKFVKAANGDVQNCLTCHGQDYNGGSANVSCLTCHKKTGGSIHGRGWIDTTSTNFHGKAIRVANWDMRPCQSCHGATYSGGRIPVSCRTCHTGGAGPENCSTCHGSANNPAPPRDLTDNTVSSARGVGAHQRHLNGGGATTNFALACGNCHNVPSTVYSPGHVDTPGPAEVSLSSGLAVADPTGVPGPPRYNADSLTCSNTFCHGNWSLSRASSPNAFWYTDSVMTGGNRPVRWTGGSAAAACGTCHGLPPAGHVSGPSILHCGSCHIGIVSSDGRTITDKTRHMNGKIDVFLDPPRDF